MKSLSAFSLGLAALVLAGCSTIEFTQGPNPGAPSEAYQLWHHNLALSLYEYSPPVNLDGCQAGWNVLIVEKDIVTAFAGSVDQAVLFGVDVWDPWAVRLEC